MRKNEEVVKEEKEQLKGRKDWKKLRTFVFCFSLLGNHLNFFGSTKMEISTRKRLKSHQEKIGKSDFAPHPPPSCFIVYRLSCAL